MQIAGEEIERLRRQIMEQIDLTRTVEDEEVYQLIEAQVRDFARERMLTLGEREAVVQTLFYSLRKLDVLQELLEDPTITEIMVNGAEHIFYEKAGRLYKAEYGLETMVLMGMELPLPAIRSQIASGIDILIHLGRLRDKSRKVLKIVEIAGMEQGEVMLHELFRYKESGEEARPVRGTLMRTGRLMHTEKCERAGMNPEKEGSSGL